MNSDGLHEVVGDTSGLTRFIIDGLDAIETDFYTELVETVAATAGVTVTPSLTDRVVDRLKEVGLDLRSGNIQGVVTDLLTEANRESPWASFLDRFVRSRPGLSLPFSQRQLVLAELDRLVLPPGQRDGIIAQAIAQVVDGTGTDPVQLTRPAGRALPWDFRVDLFDDARDQIVLETNVRAAGSLMWCYDIGERLGVYKLADALVYRWWIGLVDFGDPNLTSELYRYYKLRDERPAEEERFLLYRRILNLGASQVSDRVVVNEEFPTMWRTLMEEVATYIDRTENSFRDRVNRQGVEQAIRELQYNLTERMAGMALTQVTEMYNQLRQTDRGGGALGALDIMEHPEVIGQLSSGRRRDEWSVIERLAKEEFGMSPNVSALRTSAIKGFEVVDYIATFNPGHVDQDRFDDFVDAAKAWILTQRLAGDGLLVQSGDGAGTDAHTGDEDTWGSDSDGWGGRSVDGEDVPGDAGDAGDDEAWTE